ncbi:hypothetical protein GGI22_005328, partial [Coemansia erecta]
GVDRKDNVVSVTQTVLGDATPSIGAKPAGSNDSNAPKNVKVDATKSPTDKKPQATGSAKDKQVLSKEKERRNAKESMSASPDSNGASRQVGASAALAGAAALLGAFF